MGKKRVTIIFLTALTLFALYLCYKLFQPFLSPLLSALVKIASELSSAEVMED